ncbi:MAG: amino acid permease, partial [Deltaproteobacteria bacterium]|nr:amino acid permease [Deltaproteobacteria bacterium]
MEQANERQGEPGAAGLVPRLGLFTAVTLVIGSMIGSGIFKKTAVMAGELHSAWLVLAAWVLGGLVTLVGALTNAEISSMIPATGGQYVYFRRIYNDFFGYLYGWAIFAVIQTGSIASIAYVFAEYSGYFLPLPRLAPQWEAITFSLGGVITIAPFAELSTRLLTVATILLLTGVNCLGVAIGGALQDVFTLAKLAAIALIIVLGFTASGGSLAHLASTGSSAPPGTFLALVGAMGLALSGAFWAYDGWNNITYVAGEVRQPQRNIPRALVIGTVVVIAVYVLTNLAYLYVLPLAQIEGSKLVAADVARSFLGWAGGAFVAATVMVSTFGTTNGTTLLSARMYFAMARDGLFFRRVGTIHRRFRTPHVALLVQGIWASLLVFTGTFDQLTDMLIFVSWAFYAAGAAGVFVLRRKMPDAPRPYRVPGYPWLPAIFVLFATAYVAVSLVQSPRNSLFGLLLVALGLVPYF